MYQFILLVALACFKLGGVTPPGITSYTSTVRRWAPASWFLGRRVTHNRTNHILDLRNPKHIFVEETPCDFMIGEYPAVYVLSSLESTLLGVKP